MIDGEAGGRGSGRGTGPQRLVPQSANTEANGDTAGRGRPGCARGRGGVAASTLARGRRRGGCQLCEAGKPTLLGGKRGKRAAQGLALGMRASCGRQAGRGAGGGQFSRPRGAGPAEGAPRTSLPAGGPGTRRTPDFREFN